MSLKLYADVHVRRAVGVALRVRGVDMLTAQTDGAAELEDSELLDRASSLGRGKSPSNRGRRFRGEDKSGIGAMKLWLRFW